MGARVEWEGLDELKEWLRTLTPDLASEAGPIVTKWANRAKQDIGTAYPNEADDLRSHLSITRGIFVGRYGAGVAVQNSSKIAFIFENGTQARHTDLGYNRGAMPPGHVFIPIVIRCRIAMYEELKAMMQAHGLEVSGSA